MRTVKLLVIFFILSKLSYSQTNALKLDLDKNKGTYVRAFVLNQFWIRYIDMNPGTTLNGKPLNENVDFSVRRMRLGILAQLTPKLFVTTMFGENDINIKNSKKSVMNVLDLNVEYNFSKGFTLGFGKNAWHGLSRLMVRSTISLLSLDAPVFSLLTVNKNDHLVRGLGFWAKGQLYKFDYVLSVNQPLIYGFPAKEGITNFALNNPKMRYSGYVKYEFLDDESNKMAYSGGAGTYIGKKRILNLGAGFLYQPEMTSRLIKGKETFYDFKNWVVEIFYDVPLNKEKGTAITTYLGYFNTDFGLDYIRNIGLNGYTVGGTTFNGTGNSFPMMGTGNTIFAQLGYVLPKSFLGKNNKKKLLQPNFSVQYSNFDALNEEMMVFDVGLNILFNGHKNKLSFNYQDRPIYEMNSANKLTVSQRKGQFVAQYQVLIN